ncbi:hypothetical protein ABE493_17345 [Stenotrophomonas terrae]|uniref:hypothetical protein n=1 Tax=Stenotrophomonas terrae TaxID=405446 RepID=UPI003209FEEA
MNILAATDALSSSSEPNLHGTSRGSVDEFPTVDEGCATNDGHKYQQEGNMHCLLGLSVVSTLGDLS